MKSVFLTLINLLLVSKTCQGYKVGYRDVMMAKEVVEARDHHPLGQEHPHLHHPRGTVAVDASMASVMDQIFAKDQVRGSADSLPSSMGKFKSVLTSSSSTPTRSKISSKTLSASEPELIELIDAKATMSPTNSGSSGGSADSLPSMGKFKSVLPSSTPIRSKTSSKPSSSSEVKSMDVTSQRGMGSLSATKLLKSSVRQETRTPSDTITNPSFSHDGKKMDHKSFDKVNTDAKLDAAIESLQDLVNSKVFQPKSSFLEDWESFESQEQTPEIRVVRSVEEKAEDKALKEAIKSFESVMEDTISAANSRSRRSVSAKPYTASSKEVEDYILRQLRESHDSLSRASVRVLDNRYEAHKLLEKSKNILAALAKAIELKEIDEILEKLASLPTKKAKVKRSTEDNEVVNKKMIARGFNTKEYNWLSKEFLLTKKEVDEVKNLSEEEFQLFSANLMEKTDMTSLDGGYTAEDLISVLKSARQLVPSELEAAAVSIVEVGKHLGGRARYLFI